MKNCTRYFITYSVNVNSITDLRIDYNNVNSTVIIKGKEISRTKYFIVRNDITKKWKIWLPRRSTSRNFKIRH